MKCFYVLIVLIILVIASNTAQAQWEPDVRMSNDTAYTGLGFSKSRCIAASGDSVHLVWHSRFDGKRKIFYRRSTDGGLNWESEKALTNDTISLHPTIAISGSIISLVWFESRDGIYGIYYKRSTNGGTDWEPEKRLTDNTSKASYPSIAVSGSLVCVAWGDLRDGNYEIYYNSSTDNGVNWGPEQRLTNDAGISWLPSIAVSGSLVHIVRGGATTTDGNSAILYKQSTDGGTSWKPEFQLNSTYHGADPCIAVLDSFVHIVWKHFDSKTQKTQLYYNYSTDGGKSWKVETLLNPNKSISASIAVSGSLVHIVWSDERSGNYDIYYKCSTDGGINWGTDVLLSDNQVTKSDNPSIVTSGSILHIAWSDNRDGPKGEIYYKRNPTGNITGIDDLEIAESDCSVFPNPARDFIKITLKPSEGSEINIYNILGEIVMSESIHPMTASHRMNIESLPKGMYFVKVGTETTTFVKM